MHDFNDRVLLSVERPLSKKTKTSQRLNFASGRKRRRRGQRAPSGTTEQINNAARLYCSQKTRCDRSALPVRRFRSVRRQNSSQNSYSGKIPCPVSARTSALLRHPPSPPYSVASLLHPGRSASGRSGHSRPQGFFSMRRSPQGRTRACKTKVIRGEASEGCG